MSYSDQQGENFNKKVIRQIILDSCEHLRNRVGLRALTLPNKYTYFEDKLMTRYNISSIHCFEKIRSVFMVSKWKFRDYRNVTVLNMDVLKFTRGTFDICWLDFTGCPCDRLSNGLKNFFSNNFITHNGIVSITVSDPSRAKEFISNYSDDYMEKVFEKEIIKLLPKGTVLFRKDTYVNTPTRMYNFIFKLN